MRDKKKVLLCAKSAITHGSGLSLSFFFSWGRNNCASFMSDELKWECGAKRRTLNVPGNEQTATQYVQRTSVQPATAQKKDSFFF